jgi:SAM-dependent methyltransferase
MNERALVAQRYDRVADAYVRRFSPVIRPFALPLLERLELSHARRILDVGCGAGMLVGDWQDASPQAWIAGVDISEGMLAHARCARVAADARSLPFQPGAFDAAVTVFMLQHVSDPRDAFAEMLRVVAGGGGAASVTWGTGSTEESERIWNEELDRAGAAAPQSHGHHPLYDDEHKMRRWWSDAGATAVDAWTRVAEHRWDDESLWTLLTTYGSGGERYAALSASAQQEVLAAARTRVAALGDDALVWRPTIVYAVARAGTR